MITQEEFNGTIPLDCCPKCATKFVVSPNYNIMGGKKVPLWRCAKCREDYIMITLQVENDKC